jgi:hypothetical protein
MCWKCCHQITKDDENGGFSTLVGCEICTDVVDFATAQQFCPLTKQTNASKKRNWHKTF